MAEPNEKPKKLVKVVIAVDGHTHQGEPVNKGATIEVDEETAAWMRAQQPKLIED